MVYLNFFIVFSLVFGCDEIHEFILLGLNTFFSSASIDNVEIRRVAFLNDLWLATCVG